MTDQDILQAMRQMIQESESRMGQMMDQKLNEQLTSVRADMGQMMDRKLSEQLTPIREDIEEIKESLEEVRTSTNMLISWTEKVSTAVHFPLPAIDE